MKTSLSVSLCALLLLTGCPSTSLVDKGGDDTNDAGDDTDEGGGDDTDEVDQDDDGYNADVDCDDEDPDIHPNAEEICDEIDNDCDEEVDEDEASTTWYRDEDDDRYGSDDDTVESCERPEGYAPVGGDCDDSDAGVNPGAEELEGDGVDEDCDGQEICYEDADNDGYRSDETTISSDDDCSDSGEALYADDDGDCDDADDDIYPGARDVEDDEDNDCDGRIDEDAGGGGGGGDDLAFGGYYIVGTYDRDWECLNYYSAYGLPYSDELLCDSCDYSLLLYAEYAPGALEDYYPECDWDELEYWGEIDYFYTLWGFAYEPDSYYYPVAYYYYLYSGGWYPWAYFYYGDSGYGYDYLQWVFFAQYDSDDLLEAGLFFGYLYEY